MLRGQISLRSLLNSSFSYNYCYYNNSCNWGCSNLMSSATTATAAASAAAASVSSFTTAKRVSNPFGGVCLSSSKIGAKSNDFDKPNFRLRGCFFDYAKQNNSISYNSSKDVNFNHYSSSVNGNEVQKARQYAPSLARLQLLHGGSEGDDSTRVLDRGDGGASQRGSCVRSSGGNGEKFVVAVDVDEVLGNFVSALNRFIADRYSLNHSVSEYHVYEFFKIWNCSRDEADTRVHEFFKTSYFKKGIHPIPGAHEALQKLSRFCDLSIVTSRQNAIKEDTIEWIEKHYPGIFQEIHFGNHFALDGLSRPKSDICRSLGAKVLIDDNPRYAIECAEVGMRVLLFDYENSYPWSKMDSVDQHPLVTKVHNWKEVEHHIASWSVS